MDINHILQASEVFLRAHPVNFWLWPSTVGLIVFSILTLVVGFMAIVLVGNISSPEMTGRDFLACALFVMILSLSAVLQTSYNADISKHVSPSREKQLNSQLLSERMANLKECTGNYCVVYVRARDNGHAATAAEEVSKKNITKSPFDYVSGPQLPYFEDNAWRVKIVSYEINKGELMFFLKVLGKADNLDSDAKTPSIYYTNIYELLASHQNADDYAGHTRALAQRFENSLGGQ